MTAAVSLQGKSTAPVRGTQSFVGVMAEVWKRPLLTGIEVLWRWLFWASLCYFSVEYWRLSLRPLVIAIRTSGWSGDSLTTIAGIIDLHQRANLLRHSAVPLTIACLLWVALSAFGRKLELERLEHTGPGRFRTLFVLGLLRVVCFFAAVLIWIASLNALVQHMILGPQSRYQEPAFVPFAALVICGTLGLFVLWMAASYIFQIAPILCTGTGVGVVASFRASIRNTPLRGKLVEVNLVIGIVKIALLVLAMVFSACPLPFSSVETEQFLTCWWIGVAVWWAVASDYFHVVRAAAFLRLWQVHEIDSGSNTPGEKDAS